MCINDFIEKSKCCSQTTKLTNYPICGEGKGVLLSASATLKTSLTTQINTYNTVKVGC